MKQGRNICNLYTATITHYNTLQQLTVVSKRTDRSKLNQNQTTTKVMQIKHVSPKYFDHVPIEYYIQINIIPSTKNHEKFFFVEFAK